MFWLNQFSISCIGVCCEEILEYYRYQNIQNKLNQQSLVEQKVLEDKHKKELLTMSKKVKKLNDNKIVSVLYFIIIKKWESEEMISANPESTKYSCE